MKIAMLHDNVLVLPLDVETATPSGILLPDTVKSRSFAKGRAVAVGQGLVTTEGVTVPLRIEADDIAYYQPDAGFDVQMGGVTYRVMSESEIFAIEPGEAKESANKDQWRWLIPGKAVGTGGPGANGGYLVEAGGNAGGAGVKFPPLGGTGGAGYQAPPAPPVGWSLVGVGAGGGGGSTAGNWTVTLQRDSDGQQMFGQGRTQYEATAEAIRRIGGLA